MSSDLMLVTALRRGTLEYCVLALLADREMYGLELVRHLSDALGMTTSEGTLYPLLSRLRRTDRIASTWRESPQGPPRRYYTVTSTGERALASFRVEWEIFRSGIDRIMGKEEV